MTSKINKLNPKRLTRRQTKTLREEANPFLFLDSDPTNFDSDDEFNRRPHILRKSTVNTSNTIKHLTFSVRSGIIGLVKKLKRKDDKPMANNKTKKANAGNKLKVLTGMIWLAFAAQQTFSGFVLLSNFDNYAVVVTALTSLALAGVVVVWHFARAYAR